jgi:hypothetical protein
MLGGSQFQMKLEMDLQFLVFDSFPGGGVGMMVSIRKLGVPCSQPRGQMFR